MILHRHTPVRGAARQRSDRVNPRSRYRRLVLQNENSRVGPTPLNPQNPSAILFGKKRRGLPLHIMVTLPDDADTNRSLLRSLLSAGMSVARINCAQNSHRRWKAMISNLRGAIRDTGIPCRILMDLSGPKLRTGQMILGPRVLRVRPRRDALGHTTSPAIVWLGDLSTRLLRVSAPIVPLPPVWVKRLRKGDTVVFTDARGKRRVLTVGRKYAGGRYAELRKTAYLQSGTTMRCVDAQGVKHSVRVGVLPAGEVKIPLRKGEVLHIHRDSRPGRPAVQRPGNKALQPAHISCTLPGVFDVVKAGERVVFDNGIIEGTVLRAGREGFFVRVTKTCGSTAALRADKGINLPQTQLPPGGMTRKDRKDLRFAARNADLVSLSFVRSADDVATLRKEVAKLRTGKPGAIIKIETDQAVQNLTAILSATAGLDAAGIMMARGDLAVEHGWERLPALQLRLREMTRAAGLPLVIATEILDTMAKKGIPSRAELNDVAMARDAECILLGKGPYIVQAVRMAGNVLRASFPEGRRGLMRRTH